MAYAAESPFVAGLDAIPPKAIIYVLGLAIIGGAAGTLTKLCKPDTVVRNLPLEIVKDLMASIVAGLLAFFFTSWASALGFWIMAGSITLAGYGGSKVLDIALGEGLLPWVRDFMRRVFNLPSTPPTDGSK